jgi:hypothetical protein
MGWAGSDPCATIGRWTGYCRFARASRRQSASTLPSGQHFPDASAFWLEKRSETNGQSEMANQDFKEFFASLNAQKVSFLIIGGVAYNHYAPPRATKDIDIWVQPCVDNCTRLVAALAAFGFPTERLDPTVLASSDQVLILGRAPNRIDVLTQPGGVEWQAAWDHRTLTDYDGVPVGLLSLPDLILMKRHAGRGQDLVDVAKLLKVQSND